MGLADSSSLSAVVGKVGDSVIGASRIQTAAESGLPEPRKIAVRCVLD